MNLKELILPYIYNLKPYSSARDEFKGKEGVFLDANENPYSSTDLAFNRYPDPLQQDLKDRISAIKNIPSKNIFLGNGSDEAIDLIIRMTCANQAGNMIVCPPTYGMYEVSGNINNAEIRQVSLNSNFQLDLPKIFESITEKTKLIFICSPNNPTGNKIDRKAIYEILDKFRTGLVIIDEAYIDFNDEPSFIFELEKYPHLIVLQTLSKAYGMASLRLGMAFAQEEIIQLLNKIKPPYNISGATQELVLKGLQDLTDIQKNIRSIQESKVELINYLIKKDFVVKVYPSNANFILVVFRDSKNLFDYLIGKEIITRYRGNVELCKDSIRISIGTKEENDKLLKNISAYFEES